MQKHEDTDIEITLQTLDGRPRPQSPIEMRYKKTTFPVSHEERLHTSLCIYMFMTLSFVFSALTCGIYCILCNCREVLELAF